MRTPGDDVDITVRVRKCNLQALLDGVELKVLQLVPIEGNVYSICVVASMSALLATPDPVDIRPVGKQ